MTDILTNIEEIRKTKGITQTVLAEKLGMRQSAYSNHISRNSDIKFSLLERISEALEVPVIDIITYPKVYVPNSHICTDCIEKDKTIQYLNEYIKVLKEESNGSRNKGFDIAI